jgi:hypothetical protein
MERSRLDHFKPYQGANNVYDTFDYSDPFAHWRYSRVALQPQLGTIPKRRHWPDRADSRDPHVIESGLSRCSMCDKGNLSPFTDDTQLHGFINSGLHN